MLRKFISLFLPLFSISSCSSIFVDTEFEEKTLISNFLSFDEIAPRYCYSSKESTQITFFEDPEEQLINLLAKNIPVEVSQDFYFENVAENPDEPIDFVCIRKDIDEGARIYTFMLNDDYSSCQVTYAISRGAPIGKKHYSRYYYLNAEIGKYFFDYARTQR